MTLSTGQLRHIWQNKQRKDYAQPVGEVVNRLLSSRPKVSTQKMERIRATLFAALPQNLQDKLTIGPLRAGELTLLCPDGPTRFEVQHREADLLRKMRDSLGRQTPRKLRVVVSSFPR